MYAGETLDKDLWTLILTNVAELAIAIIVGIGANVPDQTASQDSPLLVDGINRGFDESFCTYCRSSSSDSDSANAIRD